MSLQLKGSLTYQASLDCETRAGTCKARAPNLMIGCVPEKTLVVPAITQKAHRVDHFGSGDV